MAPVFDELICSLRSGFEVPVSGLMFNEDDACLMFDEDDIALWPSREDSVGSAKPLSGTVFVALPDELSQR